MFAQHHSSFNQLQASLLIEELARRGVRHLCLAPGSRSTPLVLAAAAHPGLMLHHHLDERGLGFLALGLAKATDAPVAVLTTSGTAVANLCPAVVEAAQTGVRLVLLTADRPPRLQECGANQAIRQLNIFSDYPRKVLALEPPTEEFRADRLLRRLGETLDAIDTPAGGVVQINCRFDEPLYPGGREQDFSALLAPLGTWLHDSRPFRASAGQAGEALPDGDEVASFCARPGIIVAAGQVRQPERIAALAERLGWPLLADIQSPLKFSPAALTQYDQLLAESDPALPGGARHLLQFGGRLVSRRLQTLVDEQDWDAFWVVHPGDYPLAPGRNQSRFFAVDAGPFCDHLLGICTLGKATQAGPIRAQDRRAAQKLSARLAKETRLTEPAAVWQLLQQVPDGHPLVAGNSLPIRLLDLLAGTAPASPRIFANRGASGIEGLIATAAGIARAGEGPATLLVGDTAFLYDLNNLLLLREQKQPLVVVLLNNDGGGIFRLLPVPDEALRRRHYQRPHGLVMADACRQFGIAHEQPETPAAFARSYRAALAAGSHRVIELCCNAEETADFLRGLSAIGQGG